MNKSRTAFGGIIFKVTSTLLMLVLVTAYLLSGLLAKYTAANASGQSARVARFSVGAVADKESFTVTEEQSGEYRLLLTNDSETAVNYTVTLTLDRQLPSWASVTMDGTAPVESDDGKTLTFDKAGSLAVNSEKTAVISFSADWQNYISEAADGSYSTIIGFEAAVKFVQID